MSLVEIFRSILNEPLEPSAAIARLSLEFIKHQTEHQFSRAAVSPKEHNLPHAWLDSVQRFIALGIKIEDWRDLQPAMVEFLRTFVASPEDNFRNLPQWESLSAQLAKRFQELAKSGRYNPETWFETGGR